MFSELAARSTLRELSFLSTFSSGASECDGAVLIPIL
jgi:hypothetical protein